jgi:hypothetical protein
MKMFFFIFKQKVGSIAFKKNEVIGPKMMFRVYPVSQFLDSQNSKWKYKSRKILVFSINYGFYIFLIF